MNLKPPSPNDIFRDAKKNHLGTSDRNGLYYGYIDGAREVSKHWSSSNEQIVKRLDGIKHALCNGLPSLQHQAMRELDQLIKDLHP